MQTRFLRAILAVVFISGVAGTSFYVSQKISDTKGITPNAPGSTPYAMTVPEDRAVPVKKATPPKTTATPTKKADKNNPATSATKNSVSPTTSPSPTQQKIIVTPTPIAAYRFGYVPKKGEYGYDTDKECGGFVSGTYCQNGKRYVVNLPDTKKAAVEYVNSVQTRVANLTSSEILTQTNLTTQYAACGTNLDCQTKTLADAGKALISLNNIPLEYEKNITEQANQTFINDLTRSIITDTEIQTKADIKGKLQALGYPPESLEKTVQKIDAQQRSFSKFFDLNISTATLAKEACSKSSGKDICLKEFQREDYLKNAGFEDIEVTSFKKSLREQQTQIATIKLVTDKFLTKTDAELKKEYCKSNIACENTFKPQMYLDTIALKDTDPNYYKQVVKARQDQINNIFFANIYADPNKTSSDMAVAAGVCKKGETDCLRNFERTDILKQITNDQIKQDAQAKRFVALENLIPKVIPNFKEGKQVSGINNNVKNEVVLLDQAITQATWAYLKDKMPNCDATCLLSKQSIEQRDAYALKFREDISKDFTVYQTYSDKYNKNPKAFADIQKASAYKVGQDMNPIILSLSNKLTQEQTIKGLSDNGKPVKWENADTKYQNLAIKKACEINKGLDSLCQKALSTVGGGASSNDYIKARKNALTELTKIVSQNSDTYLAEVFNDQIQKDALPDAFQSNIATIDNAAVSDEARKKAVNSAEAHDRLQFFDPKYGFGNMSGTSISVPASVRNQLEANKPLTEQQKTNLANEMLDRYYVTETYTRGTGVVGAVGTAILATALCAELGPGALACGAIGGTAAAISNLVPVLGTATAQEIEAERQGIAKVVGNDKAATLIQAIYSNQGAACDTAEGVKIGASCTTKDNQFANYQAITNTYQQYNADLNAVVNNSEITAQASMQTLINEQFDALQKENQRQAVINLAIAPVMGAISAGTGSYVANLKLPNPTTLLQKAGVTGINLASSLGNSLIGGTQADYQFKSTVGFIDTQSEIELTSCERKNGIGSGACKEIAQTVTKENNDAAKSNLIMAIVFDQAVDKAINFTSFAITKATNLATNNSTNSPTGTTHKSLDNTTDSILYNQVPGLTEKLASLGISEDILFNRKIPTQTTDDITLANLIKSKTIDTTTNNSRNFRETASNLENLTRSPTADSSIVRAVITYRDLSDANFRAKLIERGFSNSDLEIAAKIRESGSDQLLTNALEERGIANERIAKELLSDPNDESENRIATVDEMRYSDEIDFINAESKKIVAGAKNAISEENLQPKPDATPPIPTTPTAPPTLTKSQKNRLAEMFVGELDEINVKTYTNDEDRMIAIENLTSKYEKYTLKFEKPIGTKPGNPKPLGYNNLTIALVKIKNVFLSPGTPESSYNSLVTLGQTTNTTQPQNRFLKLLSDIWYGRIGGESGGVGDKINPNYPMTKVFGGLGIIQNPVYSTKNIRKMELAFGATKTELAEIIKDLGVAEMTNLSAAANRMSDPTIVILSTEKATGKITYLTKRYSEILGKDISGTMIIAGDQPDAIFIKKVLESGAKVEGLTPDMIKRENPPNHNFSFITEANLKGKDPVTQVPGIFFNDTAYRSPRSLDPESLKTASTPNSKLPVATELSENQIIGISMAAERYHYEAVENLDAFRSHLKKLAFNDQEVDIALKLSFDQEYILSLQKQARNDTDVKNLTIEAINQIPQTEKKLAEIAAANPTRLEAVLKNIYSKFSITTDTTKIVDTPFIKSPADSSPANTKRNVTIAQATEKYHQKLTSEPLYTYRLLQDEGFTPAEIETVRMLSKDPNYISEITKTQNIFNEVEADFSNPKNGYSEADIATAKSQIQEQTDKQISGLTSLATKRYLNRNQNDSGNTIANTNNPRNLEIAKIVEERNGIASENESFFTETLKNNFNDEEIKIIRALSLDQNYLSEMARYHRDLDTAQRDFISKANSPLDNTDVIELATTVFESKVDELTSRAIVRARERGQIDPNDTNPSTGLYTDNKSVRDRLDLSSQQVLEKVRGMREKSLMTFLGADKRITDKNVTILKIDQDTGEVTYTLKHRSNLISPLTTTEMLIPANQPDTIIIKIASDNGIDIINKSVAEVINLIDQKNPKLIDLQKIINQSNLIADINDFPGYPGNKNYKNNPTTKSQNWFLKTLSKIWKGELIRESGGVKIGSESTKDFVAVAGGLIYVPKDAINSPAHTTRSIGMQVAEFLNENISKAIPLRDLNVRTQTQPSPSTQTATKYIFDNRNEKTEYLIIDNLVKEFNLSRTEAERIVAENYYTQNPNSTNNTPTSLESITGLSSKVLPPADSPTRDYLQKFIDKYNDPNTSATDKADLAAIIKEQANIYLQKSIPDPKAANTRVNSAEELARLANTSAPKNAATYQSPEQITNNKTFEAMIAFREKYGHNPNAEELTNYLAEKKTSSLSTPSVPLRSSRTAPATDATTTTTNTNDKGVIILAREILTGRTETRQSTSSIIPLENGKSFNIGRYTKADDSNNPYQAIHDIEVSRNPITLTKESDGSILVSIPKANNNSTVSINGQRIRAGGQASAQAGDYIILSKNTKLYVSPDGNPYQINSALQPRKLFKSNKTTTSLSKPTGNVAIYPGDEYRVGGTKQGTIPPSKINGQQVYIALTSTNDNLQLRTPRVIYSLEEGPNYLPAFESLPRGAFVEFGHLDANGKFTPITDTNYTKMIMYYTDLQNYNIVHTVPSIIDDIKSQIKIISRQKLTPKVKTETTESTPTPTSPISELPKAITSTEKQTFVKLKTEHPQEYFKKIVADDTYLPTKFVEIDGKKFYISDSFNSITPRGSNYEMVIIYTTLPNGTYVARVAWKSGADGSWKVTPGTFGNTFSKGRDIHYTQETKPHHLINEALVANSKSGKTHTGNFVTDFIPADGIPHPSNTYTKEVIGHTDIPGLENVEYFRPGTYSPEYDAYYNRDYSKTDFTATFRNFKYPDGFIPDFTKQPIRRYAINDSILGKIEIEIHQGVLEGRTVEWAMASTATGEKVWIDSIYYPDSKITSYGTRAEVIDSGALTNKPLEFKQQAMYLKEGTEKNSFSTQLDDITPLLNNLEPIRMYRDSLITRSKNVESISAPDTIPLTKTKNIGKTAGEIVRVTIISAVSSLSLIFFLPWMDSQLYTTAAPITPTPTEIITTTPTPTIQPTITPTPTEIITTTPTPRYNYSEADSIYPNNTELNKDLQGHGVLLNPQSFDPNSTDPTIVQLQKITYIAKIVREYDGILYNDSEHVTAFNNYMEKNLQGIISSSDYKKYYQNYIGLTFGLKEREIVQCLMWAYSTGIYSSRNGEKPLYPDYNVSKGNQAIVYPSDQLTNPDFLRNVDIVENPKPSNFQKGDYFTNNGDKHTGAIVETYILNNKWYAVVTEANSVKETGDNKPLGNPYVYIVDEDGFKALVGQEGTKLIRNKNQDTFAPQTDSQIPQDIKNAITAINNAK